MATIASLNLATPRVVANNTTRARLAGPVRLNYPWRSGSGSTRLVEARRVRAAPDRISEKVEKSIEEAKETCADDPKSGECVAAWDEVEELSAAASHARDKQKAGGNDPLENYCKDNPETDECRTYDN
ncbi:PREDICTED: calvin cycle protein CP12-1, chloroplastic-like [Tarenaya hassleriana]|uniref:calvin cycle protein CP12-1, chloroplastic-like n=1 Tax=Tarenaya hassleriana TaxID=28532 RepID=UPI00053C21AF|nr:PREDICTED: calvin cycle protein CP12-1, chloroplastic-like [Tarenaya hassleriana]